MSANLQDHIRQNPSPMAHFNTPSKLTKLLLLVTGLLIGGHVHAQLNYAFTATTQTYSYLSGGTGLSSVQTDDAHSASVNLGFTFVYDGQNVTAVKVNSNGWISMDTGDSPGAS